MKVVVAMSGGVDSSVAAGLLAEQGHEVIGVHMKLHDAAPGAAGRSCCGLDEALDARAVADTLGVPFYVMDLRSAFEAAVKDYFADTYLAGGTPNPCVACNGVLKFQILLARARALGATHLATGHYARVDGQGRLRTAVDPDKDQSYFLYPIRPDALRATLFPLGELTKGQVRAEARRLGLATAEKAESQEICFIPDGDHHRFVSEHRGVGARPGPIVDVHGRELGQHDGHWRFTVGQRRGLGVALGRPAYVLEVDPIQNRVVVGDPEGLLTHELRAVSWTGPAPLAEGQPAWARVRHRGALHPCTVHPEADGAVRLKLLAPARAATRGQAVVLYDGDLVLGGGTIAHARALEAAAPHAD